MPATARPAAALRGSPYAGDIEVASAGDGRAVTRCTVTDGEPVLPGHYPGFPIFPGVCVVECVHRSACLTAPGGPDPALRPAAIESARFVSPVYPGDEVTVELAWREVPDGRQCRAVVRTGRGEAARVRLRYPRPEEAPA